MLKEGQQVSVYKVKEIIGETATHVCCLTEDPFFHSVVLLKVYPIDFLQDEQLQKKMVMELEKLVTQLENPSIAPVFDSGYEGRYFYYTTNYNYQAPLLEHVATGLSSEKILKIVHDLGCAIEHAIEQGLGHGTLGIHDLYLGDDGRAVIADFGIEYCFKCFLEDQELKWSEDQALQDLGRFHLQLLRPSSTDNSGRELEILSGIENEQLRKVTERFFTEKSDRYQSFSELIDALDPLIEKPPVETRPMVQRKSLAVRSETGITDQQREQVLPHVRQLISEKNHYKSLLDEALLKQNKIADQLKQTLLELEQSTQLQLMAPDVPISGNRKKIVGWALAGFAIGAILSGSYSYSLQQKNFIPKTPDNGVETQSVKVQPQLSELRSLPLIVEQPVLTKASLVVDEVSNLNIAPNPEKEIPPEPLKKGSQQTPVIVEESQQWWPAGQEFSAAITVEKTRKEITAGEDFVPRGISRDESEDLSQNLSHWINSWMTQDSAAYFSHYSHHYRPELGKSRKSWLETRKARLQRPDWIKVNIQEIKMRRLAENRVQVKFRQNYHSNFYQDQIWKSLNLVNENGTWQIITERSLGKVDLVASR
ncbi:MAG: hypothetical protein QM483_00950 [Desulfuromusa sp.]